MPTWGEYLEEIQRRQSEPNLLDKLRREALARVYDLTGRPVVLYASRWIQGGPAERISISMEDLEAFMEAFHGIKGPNLDLILHTPGGNPSVTAAIVDYMRTRFGDVRVIVPMAAMSAGTMMACSANRIVLGKHSYLGPIDVQLLLDTPLGRQMVPALGIIKQFAQAKKEISNSGKMSAWLPMLGQYGPGLLVECENMRKLSEELVASWLAKWMFKDRPDAKRKSRTVAKRLNDHDEHLTHSRYLNRDVLEQIGLVIEPLENLVAGDRARSQDLQDAILSVLHMITHTFSLAPQANKITENHLGKAFVTQTVAPGPQRFIVPQGPLPPGFPLPPGVPPPMKPQGSQAV
jgi:hypothetical protein